MGSRPSSFYLTAPGPLRLYSTQELLRLPPPSWLIDTILPAGGLIGLYGPPGHGKSFIALDWILSIAAGRTWLGHTVHQGLGLYVSAEGGTGIGKRVAAWLEYQDLQPVDVPVAWLTEALPLLPDSDDMALLLKRIHDEIEIPPTLIVIDTLARCFEGDENTQEDMGRFIQAADQLRHEFGATVVVVHHTRLDGERERGNTAFRGATDAMISVSKKGQLITVKCNKQRDAEEFASIDLQLIPIVDVDSCVVAPLEVSPAMIQTALAKVLADPTLQTLNARALALSKLTNKPKETCRSLLRRT